MAPLGTDTYVSFNDAYVASAKLLQLSGHQSSPVIDPTSVGSQFGKNLQRSTIELLAHQFSLINPRARLLSLPIRHTNLPFAIANTLWTLSGDPSIEMISFYNERGREFSRDGIQLEASFGERLFGSPNPISFAERRIRSDKSSRRAFVPIYSTSDAVIDRLDVPCAIGIHFLCRDDVLNCILYMRSQSAIMVLPYDIFLFTFMHEMIACRLGVRLGTFTHISSSFHVYRDEMDAFTKVCSISERPPLCEMLQMMDASDSTLAKAIEAEREIRHHFDAKNMLKLDVHKFDLDVYWKGLLAVLVIHALRKAGEEPALTDWRWLPQDFISRLW